MELCDGKFGAGTCSRAGDFLCTPPTTPGNHGPVGTAHQFHFQYADGTPYFPLARLRTPICSLPTENAKASIDGMKEARFNKSRVCVLPKPLAKGRRFCRSQSHGRREGTRRCT